MAEECKGCTSRGQQKFVTTEWLGEDRRLRSFGPAELRRALQDDSFICEGGVETELKRTFSGSRLALPTPRFARGGALKRGPYIVAG